MTNLERYIMLERVYADVDGTTSALVVPLAEILDKLYESLTRWELEYLWQRQDCVYPNGIKGLSGVESLDRIPLPKNMLWGALDQPRLKE